MLDLLIQEMKDDYVRENFKRLKTFASGQKLLNGSWQFVELVIPSAVINFKFAHNLGFAPRDIIQTSSIGAGVLTWNYSLFDNVNLDLTTTGAVTVRFFVGTYVEGSEV